MFELAVLELKEIEALEPIPRPGQNGTIIQQGVKDKWRRAIQSAIENLDRTMQLATNSTDLSSRLDTRVNMLRDEIMARKEFLGIWVCSRIYSFEPIFIEVEWQRFR